MGSYVVIKIISWVWTSFSHFVLLIGRQITFITLSKFKYDLRNIIGCVLKTPVRCFKVRVSRVTCTVKNLNTDLSRFLINSDA